MPRLVEKSLDNKIDYWTRIRDEAQQHLDDLIAKRADAVGKDSKERS